MSEFDSGCAFGDKDLDVPVLSVHGFRLIYLRLHFFNGSGVADLTISLDSVSGDEHDTLLYTVLDCGVGADVNLVFENGPDGELAPWRIGACDALRLRWTNPGTVTWGVEWGIELL